MTNKQMKKPRFIGLMGQKQAGKDTTAAIIKSLQANKHLESFLDLEVFATQHSKWEIVAFSTTLKIITSFLTGCATHHLEQEDFKNQLIPNYLQTFIPNDIKEHGTITYRDFLQYVGTNLFRAHCENIWVDILLNRLTYGNNEKFTGYYLISDVRFQNEIDAIRQSDPNSLIIKIERGEERPPEHISEDIAKLPYDILIKNNGTLEDLYTQVQTALTEANISL